MVQTFPLPINQFFEGLPIRTYSFGLGEALEYAETGGGETLTADVGNRLWEMSCEIKPGHYGEIEQIKAKLDVLRYAGRSLLVHSMGLTAPQSDPDGSVLGSNTVQLHTVQSNNREIKLSGLPAGYVLTAGDFLSFEYGSSPTRYAFHQIAVGSTANGSGITGFIELSSFVRQGFTLTSTVKLIKPTMKMIVRPGSTGSGKSAARFTDGVKFDLIQTLR